MVHWLILLVCQCSVSSDVSQPSRDANRELFGRRKTHVEGDCEWLQVYPKGPERPDQEESAKGYYPWESRPCLVVGEDHHGRRRGWGWGLVGCDNSIQAGRGEGRGGLEMCAAVKEEEEEEEKRGEEDEVVRRERGKGGGKGEVELVA